jgi:hypothetical protein
VNGLNDHAANLSSHHEAVIDEISAWSFVQCHQNKFPDVDHLGEPFKDKLRKNSQFREFSYYRKEFINDKEEGLTNEEVFDDMVKKKGKQTQRGSCPDITYQRQVSTDSGPQSSPLGPPLVGDSPLGLRKLANSNGKMKLPRYNSDLGLSLAVEKRRRGMVLNTGDKMHVVKTRNFMKFKHTDTNKNVFTPEKREAAAIVMTALRKFFFIGEDSFDRMPMVIEGLETEKVRRRRARYRVRPQLTLS